MSMMDPENGPGKRGRRGRRILVLVLPDVHALDLAGPVQVFFEACAFGASYDLVFCGVESRVRTAQGFWISDLESLGDVGPDDWVMVPGIDSRTLGRMAHVPVAWLRDARDAGARLASICSGAWVLAHAGLLDNFRCTTHWKIADALQESFPAVDVLRDRLFVRDGQVMTSAGIASGIDMALAMLEEDRGPLIVAKVAREMVVYLRRDGGSPQGSVYLEHRTHLEPGVHRVQDWMVNHPDEQASVEQLATIACMSPRHLSRVFKRATGVGLKAFAMRLKVEIATNLLHAPGSTVEGVAARCGFADARQLRRLWQRQFGLSPSAWQARESGGN